jgi:hypothetical protein
VSAVVSARAGFEATLVSAVVSARAGFEATLVSAVVSAHAPPPYEEPTKSLPHFTPHQSSPDATDEAS